MADRDQPTEDERRRLKRIRRAAVAADSNAGAVRAARWLRSRLPGDQRFGDVLSTAGEGTAEMIARRVTALEPDRPSASHEIGLAALQLWQGLSEASGRGRGSDEVTILFADLVAFSAWALEAGDDAAIELLRQVGAATEQPIGEHGGAVVKRLGDGLMAVFPGVEQAVGAAFGIRARLAEIEVDGHRPRMRFGIHHGRPRRLGGDYFGVDVNTAARVMDAADGDQVLVSQPACAALAEDRFRLGRAKKLKATGTPHDLRVIPVESAH